MAEFALAASILSTIGFAIQLWTDSSEVRKSGMSISTADCRRQADSLRAHCDRVRLLQDSETELDEAVRMQSRCLDNHIMLMMAKARIRDIATEIHEFGEELSTRLAKSTLKPGVEGWRRYHDVIVVLWRGMRMDADAQMRRLGALRNELQSELLVSMLRKVSFVDLQNKEGFRKLDDDLKALTLTVLQGLAAVVTKVDSLAVAGEQRHLEVMAELRKWDPMATPIRSAATETIDLAWKKEKIKDLKNRLWYGAMPRRHDAITTAHEKTFEWIFTGQKKTPESNMTMMEWMVAGTGPYWVSGRAGTGKSSLMRFLNDDARTREAFQAWAGERPLGMASFYFWNSDAAGDNRLKSLAGLYRAILFELIEQHPILVETFFPGHMVRGRRWDDDFPTFLDMAQAFDKLSNARTLPVAVGLIIDGLDEYEAPSSKQIEAAEMLRRASESPNIKVIVSSRPEAAFEMAFRGSTKLRLHELTEEDRRTFVSDKIKAVPRLLTITTEEQQSELIKLVVERSEGIFLWVHLAVGTQIEEIGWAMDVSRLLKVVTDIPGGNRELDVIFDHMLRRRIPERHRALGLRLIQTLKYGYTLPWKLLPWLEHSVVRHPITAVLCSFFEEDVDVTVKRPVLPLTETQTISRIDFAMNMVRQSCAGLLEFRKFRRNPTATGYEAVVDMELHFLHKDVAVYLDTAETAQIFQPPIQGDDANIELNMLKCMVCFIKALSMENPTAHFRDEAGPAGTSVWPYIEFSMQIARDAEQMNPEQTELLLDEMDRTVDHQSQLGWLRSVWDNAERTEYWTNYFPVDFHYVQSGKVDTQCLTFLSLAVQQDLFFYVQAKVLQQGTRALLVPGRPLLNIACGTDPFWWLLRGRRPARAVRLFLDHGADPNQYFDGRTAWQTALHVARQSSTTTFEERREIGEVLLALLGAGADIQALVEWTQERRIGTRRWVSDHFSRTAAEQIRLTFVHGDVMDPGRYSESLKGGGFSDEEVRALVELGKKLLKALAEKRTWNMALRHKVDDTRTRVYHQLHRWGKVLLRKLQALQGDGT